MILYIIELGHIISCLYFVLIHADFGSYQLTRNYQIV